MGPNFFGSQACLGSFAGGSSQAPTVRSVAFFGSAQVRPASPHATFTSCFVAVLVRAQLASFDRTLEEAALDLGARPFAVLWRITLPGISPALVSGWLLAFTLSLDDLVVASFVSGPSATTLPMAVYSSVRIGVTPEVNALATLFLACVGLQIADDEPRCPVTGRWNFGSTRRGR